MDIKLDNTAFQAYYKDNWSWKKTFQVTNATYAMKASTYQAV